MSTHFFYILHIKLKEMEHRAPCKHILCPYTHHQKDDEEDDMEDDSVVFTDSSSSDHLPKGTLSRLPTN